MEYSPGAELAGATPAFVPPLLVFNEVMRRWRGAVPQPITVEGVHAHVVSGWRLRIAGCVHTTDRTSFSFFVLVTVRISPCLVYM